MTKDMMKDIITRRCDGVKGIEVALNDAFEPDTMMKLAIDIERGVDVSAYAKPEFSGEQISQLSMVESVSGHEACLLAANPEFTPDQIMTLGTIYSLHGYDIAASVAKPELSKDEMVECATRAAVKELL